MDQMEVQTGETNAAILERVFKRYHQMTLAKSAILPIWQKTRELYDVTADWIVSGDKFNKPIRFPTLHDVTVSLSDRYNQDYPTVALYAKGAAQHDLVLAKQELLRHKLESAYEKRVRRQVIQDMFQYGVGFRVVDKFDDDCSTYWIDVRDVFIDETAKQIHDERGLIGARDVILRRLLPLSSFKQKYKEMSISGVVSEAEGYLAKNVQQDVTARPYQDAEFSDYRVTTAQENIEKFGAYFVRVYEYQNQEDDEFVLIADRQVIFRSTLTEAKGSKHITVVDYRFEPSNDRLWGVSIGELIAPHIYTRDQLINLELMNLRLTLQPVLAISSDFGWNPDLHKLQPGGVWQAGGMLNGKVSDAVTPIVAGNPNTKFYNMHGIIQSEMTITSRSDIRALEYYQGKTATETMTIDRNVNSHTNTVQTINEVESETVLATILLDMMRSLIAARGADFRPRKIPVEGYTVNGSGRDMKLLERSGFRDYLEVSEDLINVDCDVEVIDNRGKKASEAEEVGRLMQFMQIMGNFAQLNPEVAKVFDPVKTAKLLSEKIGIPPEKVFTEDSGTYTDPFDLIREEILLGNKVEVPKDEDRDELMKRLAFLAKLKKEAWEKMDTRAREAWGYHESQAVERISANHTILAAMQDKQEEQAQSVQPVPSRQTNPMSVTPSVPTPDAGLLGIQSLPNNTVV